MEMVHGGDIYTYEGVIDFSVNVNPFGPSKAVVEAAKSAIDEMEHYPDIQCRRLRKALAEETGLREDSFIFGNGAAELIFSLVQAEHPKKAVIAVPAFVEYERALESVGCQIQFYQRKEENGFALEDDFLDLLKEDVDMVFVCNPNNPTGMTADKKLLKKLLWRCEGRNIRVVLDESFVEFLENAESVTLINETIRHKILFMLRSFTKMHAIPGLRLGYGICSDKRLMERIEGVRQHWSVSLPAQAAGLAALKDKRRMKTIRDFAARERRWLTARLDELGIPYFESKVNYILIKSELDLFPALLERKILIRDCSNYKGLGRGFYRIAVRQRGDNHKLIEALEEVYREEEIEAEIAESMSREGEPDGEINHDSGHDVECG